MVTYIHWMFSKLMAFPVVMRCLRGMPGLSCVRQSGLKADSFPQSLQIKSISLSPKGPKIGSGLLPVRLKLELPQ